MFKLILFLLAPAGSALFAQSGSAARAAVAKVAPAAVGVVQSRALDAQGSDPSAFSGMLELWFDDEDAALAAAQDPAAFDQLLARGATANGSVVAIERTVLRLPAFAHGEGIKGVFPFNRKPRMSITDFQRYWWHRHGPMAAQTQGATGYLQYHPPERIYTICAPAFDGVTELYWPDRATALAAMASPQMTGDQRNDSLNFADPGSVRLVLAVEDVILPP